MAKDTTYPVFTGLPVGGVKNPNSSSVYVNPLTTPVSPKIKSMIWSRLEL